MLDKIEFKLEPQFTEKQLQAIELSARAEYEGLTQAQIAKEVGVSDRTLRRWKEDKKFKDAVGRKSLELITELSPMVFKATADFLQSKDNRIRSKGVDTFLKATEKIEQLNKQEEEANKPLDMDAILESLNICTLRTAKNPEKYLTESIYKAKESLEWAVSRLPELICNKHMLELLKTGEPIEAIARIEEQPFEADTDDIVKILNEVLGHKLLGIKDIVVLSKTEYERMVPEMSEQD